jgi:hypothetical protein
MLAVGNSESIYARNNFDGIANAIFTFLGANATFG